MLQLLRFLVVSFLFFSGLINASEVKLSSPTSPPVLTRLPDSIVRAPSGSSVRWTCESLGTPTPVLKWTKEGAVISGNGTLTLKSLSPADEGHYECLAVNEAGMAAREVTLYVIGGDTSPLSAENKENANSLR